MLFLKSKPGVVWVVVVFFSSTSILLGSWKLRNFLRLINASMKEATAKRPLLKDFIELEINDFPVPADSGRSPQPAVALQIDGFLKYFELKNGWWPLVAARLDRPWLWKSMIF